MVVALCLCSFLLGAAVCHVASSGCVDDALPPLRHYAGAVWTEPRHVVSIPMDFDNWEDRRALSQVIPTLELHAPAHTCICMHHLEISREVTPRHVCALSLAAGHSLVMVNPIIRGASKDAHMYRQWSVACPRVLERARAQSIHVEWTDWKTHTQHWARIDNLAAACVELAVEEMTGQVECNDTFTSPS